jgi:16S rRNA (uracil1498-N3)-methyltransferase
VTVGDGPKVVPARPPVRLFVGAAEAPRLDLVAEKATELGVREIAVFRSERADRAPRDASWDKRRRRLERVAGAAALQAGWGAPPTVSGVLAFDDVLATPAPGHGYLLDPEADTTLDAALDRSPDGGTEVCLVIGPPAGFSRDEVGRAAAVGLRIVRLGDGVLRTETAAISALAVTVSALAGSGGA